jgi:hypothetical protein
MERHNHDKDKHPMLKKKHILIIFILLLGVIASILIFSVPNFVKAENLRNKQEELALKLGINITDYPYPSAFPDGYFYSVLKPGMPLEEVHQLVNGYEKVFNCGKYGEIYYYFSENDNDAHKFMIIYDQDYTYQELRGEDKNSDTIGTAGWCNSGLLENK